MLILFRGLSRLPLWLLHALGGLLGWMSYLGSSRYRRRFDANAAQAAIAPALARRAVAQSGRLVMELPYLWLRPAQASLGGKLQWDGDALITQAHAQGKGIVFLTPHMGSFEVTAQGYAERFAAQHGPITVLYRPARKAWLRELVDTSRARPGLATAAATLAGVRQMIRALRKGEAVGLLPDQVPPADMGVWAPFFGRPAYTMTLAARLAQQTGAVLLLAWGERLPRGRGWVIHLAPFTQPLPDAAAGAAAQAESAAAVNRAMEDIIRRSPQQYLWGYDRYKAPRAEMALDGAQGAADHKKD